MVQPVRRQYRAYAGFVTTPQFFDDSPTQFLKVAPPGTGVIQRVNHIDDYEFTLSERARNFGGLEEAAIWPGGAPTGEDEGFNGIIVRTEAGEDLVASAAAAGELVLGGPITPREFDDFQPH